MELNRMEEWKTSNRRPHIEWKLPHSRATSPVQGLTCVDSAVALALPTRPVPNARSLHIRLPFLHLHLCLAPARRAVRRRAVDIRSTGFCSLDSSLVRSLCIGGNHQLCLTVSDFM
ncbi:hypothetical protein HZ326_23567 [Fusarium oxysporum f. sp. albedinis]|nr:hypothetical protein HZ326_23567 [Fusarium oxysporum f. sp. albedinis]